MPAEIQGDLHLLATAPLPRLLPESRGHLRSTPRVMGQVEMKQVDKEGRKGAVGLSVVLCDLYLQA